MTTQDTSSSSAMVDLAARNEAALSDLRDKFSQAAADVRVTQVDWRAMMESGALAQLSISRYRGTKALTAADLGLPADDMDQVNGIVELGHRLLLPKDVLNSFNTVETRARQILRAYCLLTPMGLFLPAAAYERAAAAIADHKARFMALVDLTCDNLAAHQDTMRAEYLKLAGQVYDRLLAARVIYSSTDYWQFTTDFTDRCMALFPSEAALRASFDFRLTLSFVPLPYQADQQVAPDFANATADLLALRKQVLEDQQRARQELTQGFISSVQSELFGAVNDALADVLAAINSNGNLQARSVVQLRNLCEKIGQLNFWQDRRLDVIQTEILALLDRPAGSRSDSGLAADLLSELQQQARNVIVNLETAGRGDLALAAGPLPAAPMLLPAGTSEKLPGLAALAAAPTFALPANGKSGKLF